MKNEYRLFRIFCAASIAMLTALLVMTGIMTAKQQTEQTVFGSSFSSMRVYQTEKTALFNFDGKIAELDRKRAGRISEVLSYTLFAPYNNIITFVRNVAETGK